MKCYEIMAAYFSEKAYAEGSGEIYYTCPFCGKKKRKFSVKSPQKIARTGKDGFKCWSCGAQGGSKDLLNHFGVETQEQFDTKIKEYQVEEVTKQSNEYISKVYVAFLNMLPLYKKHKENLIQRGLTPEQIKSFKFKSAPDNYIDKLNICRELSKRFELKGVPGFYKTKKGKWNFLGQDGYYCPVWDSRNNLIIGMQIRLDKPLDDNKYLWFSTPEKQDGCGSGSIATHLKGNPENNSVIVTEGILKATITYLLLNKEITVIGLGGITQLKAINPYLAELKDKYIIEAYDMERCLECKSEKDNRKKQEILKWETALLSGFQKNNIPCCPIYWDKKGENWQGKYKGIDDYLASLSEDKRKGVIEYIKEKGQ